jgi:predicted DCC family thiol-disulfide oxidoreductase YuxK
MQPVSQSQAQAVVFFDGVCGLCNGFVDQLLRMDRKRALRFSPLQSPYAQSVLPMRLVTAPYSTIVVQDSDGRLYERSEAVLFCARTLGGPVSWGLGLGTFLPQGLRDSVYDRIAKNRYLWFGKRSTCRLPTPEEKERFLFDV